MRNCEFYVNLKSELEKAEHGKCAALVSQAAETLDVSQATVYRNLAKVGWDSGRKIRKDKGNSVVDQETAELVAGVLKATTRANGKKTLPLTTVVEIMENNAIPVASPSTVGRAMRRFGCHPDQVKKGSAATTLQSLHPNHVWQMDASVCVLFYLKSGGVKVIDEAVYYKNKPENLKKIEEQRVIRWVITDHYSGAFFVRYTLGSENSMDALEVLTEAMCQRGSQPFYGVPFYLQHDKGAGNMAGIFQGFLKNVGVKALPHKTGNARAKGQVESTQNLVETQFEGRLSLEKIESLEQLNQLADRWQRMFNSRHIHKRHGYTRYSMWLSITEEQLRVPQSVEVLRDLVGGESQYKVSNKLMLHKSIKGFGPMQYDLRYIPGIIVGEHVGVKVNPFKAPAIDVIVPNPEGEAQVYTVEPIRLNKAGFNVNAPVIGEEIQAMPDTVVDAAIKRMDKEAYNVATLEEAEKAKAKQTPAYTHKIDPMADVKAATIPNFMPRQGTDLAAGFSQPAASLPPLNAVEAAKRLRPLLHNAGLEWGQQQMAWLKANYPNGVPVNDLGMIAGMMIDNQTPAAEEPIFQLVSGA